jgi:dienelactone hydrolase
MVGLFAVAGQSMGVAGSPVWWAGYACDRLHVMPLLPSRLAGDGTPPALLFVPPGEHEALPLVLFGHGAHLSKDDPIMQMIAKGFCRGVPAAVAVLDCPGHGERRGAEVTDDRFEADIARRMSDPATYAQLIADWRAVERAARAADARITGATGYAGFSMGAMFGLAIVADLPSVTAAVFALGGLTHLRARDELIRAGVARLGGREVLMLNMTRDEHFPLAGAVEMLEAMPGPKRMSVWTGTHVDLPPEAIQVGVAFFGRTLTR